MNEKASVKKKTGKSKKVLPAFIKLRISILQNNIRADALNNENGECFFQKTSGTEGFKNSKKTTPFCSSKVITAACNEIIARGCFEIGVEFHGFGIGKDAAYRVINEFARMDRDPRISVKWIAEDVVIPHNGVRPKKPRRL